VQVLWSKGRKDYRALCESRALAHDESLDALDPNQILGIARTDALFGEYLSDLQRQGTWFSWVDLIAVALRLGRKITALQPLAGNRLCVRGKSSVRAATNLAWDAAWSRMADAAKRLFPETEWREYFRIKCKQELHGWYT